MASFAGHLPVGCATPAMVMTMRGGYGSGQRCRWCRPWTADDCEGDESKVEGYSEVYGDGFGDWWRGGVNDVEAVTANGEGGRGEQW